MPARVLVFVFLVHAFHGLSCCRINRLGSVTTAIETVSFDLKILQNPTIRFTRHERTKSRFVVKPGPDHAYSENRFADLLESFGPSEILSDLTDEVAPGFEDKLGWVRPAEDDTADVELRITIEEYCMAASDALTEVAMDWKLRVELVENRSKEILWRECLEWRGPGLGVSVYDLSRMLEEDRDRFVRSATLSLVEKLEQEMTDDNKEDI